MPSSKPFTTESYSFWCLYTDTRVPQNIPLSPMLKFQFHLMSSFITTGNLKLRHSAIAEETDTKSYFRKIISPKKSRKNV